MRSILFLLFLFPFCAVSQQTQKQATILHRETEQSPFSPSSIISFLDKDSVAVTGIPEFAAHHKISVVRWDKDRLLYILNGRDVHHNYVIAVDADFDKSFEGEIVYRFDKHARSNKELWSVIEDTLTPTLVRQSNGQTVGVLPQLYSNLKFSDELEQKWRLLVTTREYKKGSVLINGKTYTIAMGGTPNVDYFQKSATFLLKHSESTFKKPDLQTPYQLKEPFYIDNIGVTLDSLSQFADTLWVQTIINPTNIKGHRTGEYAAQIEAPTLGNSTFSLRKHRGKYVLLDFWGSWCAPCIELIPNLKRLYIEFGNRPDFLMISIALDKKADAAKLQGIIKSQEMTWIQIADWQENLNKIVDRYYIQEFPITILINPEGKIVHRGTGEKGLSEIRTLLKESQ